MLEYNSQSLYLNNLLLVEQEVESADRSVQELTRSVHTTISSTGCSFRCDGLTKTFFPDHPNYAEIRAHALQSLYSGVIETSAYTELVAFSNLVWRSRDLVINSEYSEFFGYRLPKNLHDIIVLLDHSNTELMHSWHLFLERLFNTPYLEVFSGIGDYISEYDVELDQKGFLILSKVVKANGTDTHSGTLKFNPKGRVKIPRFNLNPNPSSVDPFGIHAYPASVITVDPSPELKVINVLVPADFIVRVPSNSDPKLMVYSLFVS